MSWCTGTSIHKIQQINKCMIAIYLPGADTYTSDISPLNNYFTLLYIHRLSLSSSLTVLRASNSFHRVCWPILLRNWCNQFEIHHFIHFLRTSNIHFDVVIVRLQSIHNCAGNRVADWYFDSWKCLNNHFQSFSSG